MTGNYLLASIIDAIITKKMNIENSNKYIYNIFSVLNQLKNADIK